MTPSCCEECYIAHLQRLHETDQADHATRYAQPSHYLATFPEERGNVIRIMQRRIKNEKAHRASLLASRNTTANRRNTCPRASVPAYDAVLQHYDEALTASDARLKRLAFQLHGVTTPARIDDPVSPRHGVSDAQLDAARQYPLAEILAATGVTPARTHGARLVYRCPLPDHTEKTSSFTVYAQQNRAYCYGCHVSVDAISLYQKLYGCSFLDAVRHLSTGS